MLATRRVAALAVSAAVAVGACSSGSSAPAVKLDGSPRKPDVEGVVRAASVNGISFVGGRRYAVSKKLLSFSTYNREPVNVRALVGAYAQAGLDGDTVVWIAKVGPVATDAAGHTTVQYQGDLVDFDAPYLVFKDGTVLRLAAGLELPEDPYGPAYAVIDADKRVVQGATFAPPRSPE